MESEANEKFYTKAELLEIGRKIQNDIYSKWDPESGYDVEDVCPELFGLNREDVFDICWNSEFPGNSKWPANHPIWDAFLPGCKSPRDAWNDADLLSQAVNNMFWILNKSLKEGRYQEFIDRHDDAFSLALAGYVNDLLQLVLTRFTVAKIAPKVTALSPTQLLKVINDSDIDLAKYNGVYLPMAGFGGILEGVKRWYKEHHMKMTDDMFEAYDINQSFCDWYGWKQRDMLAQVVETDKIVIVCPPFGTNYEHWKGTPDEMSDITFIEWFDLIKQYVKAPAYIIIGPELQSNGKGNDSQGKPYNGLFRKKVGVQLWTDELHAKMKSMTVSERKKEGIKE